MMLSYKYRLYPNKTQERSLNSLRYQACSLYNSAIQERREAWKMCRKSIGLYDQTYQIKYIRQDDPDGVGKLSFQTCTRILRRVDKTFKAFFKRNQQGKHGGFPRFKPYRRFDTLEFTYGNGTHLFATKLDIMNVGQIKVRWHRPLPIDSEIKATTVSHSADNKWYVCFQIECPDIETPLNTGPVVGIDLGISKFATFSDGNSIEPPNYFRQATKELRRRQRHLARCKRNSSRRRVAVLQAAKCYAKIARRRKDFSHKLSTKLVKQYSFIAVEDLNIDALCQSTFAKSIYDVGWSQFLTFLNYKASIAGSQIVKVNPYNTSQVCSDCGAIVKKDLSERVHLCPYCGLTLDRDVNAARNILHLALKQGGKHPSDANVEFVPSCVV